MSLIVFFCGFDCKDARAAESSLTLTPSSGSLITTRGSDTSDTTTSTTSTSSASAAIGSAESDTTATTAPSTTSSSASATSVPTSGSEAPSSSSSSEAESTTDSPSSASATVSPDTSDRSITTETEVPTAASSSSTSSEASTAVDQLNTNDGSVTSSASSGFSVSTGLPIIFGALACVGALVMAVTYKKKRAADASANDEQRGSSDCGYADGASFTPDNRTLGNVMQEDTPPPILQSRGRNTQASGDFTGAIADFTGPNSSVRSMSPFGSARCNVRVSSPVQDLYANDSNMEFADSCSRHSEGSNVVLTFQEVETDSPRPPQVQL
ncbi:hypothetical protein BBJ28_00017240 [Nothophytophthora sp. Chile5]|nr:hypothetical protein BBJ28_00017240 [Nothophytophthora sp. Chile5]